MENKIFRIDREYLNQLRDMIAGVDSNNIFEDDIYNLDTFIHRITNNYNDISNDKKIMSNLRDNMGMYHSYKDLYPYIRKLLRSYLVFNRSIVPQYEEINISDSDAVLIAKEFFSKQDKFFSDSFNEFLDDDIHDHLEFITPSLNTDGEMTYVKSTGDAFVVVPNYKGLNKASILIHESEHVIDCFNNPDFFDNRIIRECASMFMELISTNYINDLYNLDDDGALRRLSIHSIIKMDSRYIYFKNQLLSIANRYKDLNSNGLKKILDYYAYSYDDIYRLNDTLLVHDYYYQISYLIAIELYNLYYKDKRSALEILKYIIMNCNDNNIFSVLNKLGITLNSSVKEYEKELELKIEL